MSRLTYRKLQLMGEHTLSVSLPSEWAKEKNLKKGDLVYISEHKNGIFIRTSEEDAMVIEE